MEYVNISVTQKNKLLGKKTLAENTFFSLVSVLYL